MRILIALTTLALAVQPLCAEPRPGLRLPPNKEVAALVQAVSDVVKKAKSLHVEATLVTDAKYNGETRQLRCEAVYDMERPNRFALRTRRHETENRGLEVVNDGEKLIVYDQLTDEYTEKSSVSLQGTAELILNLQNRSRSTTIASTGMLFQQLLFDEPGAALMEGVTYCGHYGKERIDGTEAHHLKFRQPGMNWELWIAAENRPLVLKVLVNWKPAGVEQTTVETYRNWKFDQPAAEGTFKFASRRNKNSAD